MTRAIDTVARRSLAATPPVASSLLPAAVATALAILAISLRWRGSDLPAHFFRVAIVERDGFQIWNNLWFGGHHTLGYGVLFPLLGAAFGIWPVAVASAAASAFLADVLIRQGTGRRCLPASLWFAAGTVTNVAIGRLPFALGLAIALGALVAAQRRWMVLTGVLTWRRPPPARSSAPSSPSCCSPGPGRRPAACECSCWSCRRWRWPRCW